MSFPNNHTYKVAHGISTISRGDRCSASSKTYACEAGASYRSNEEVGHVKDHRSRLIKGRRRVPILNQQRQQLTHHPTNMSFPNNHTYKVANGISTISRIDRRAANRKTYASEAGTPYTTDDQVWG